MKIWLLAFAILLFAFSGAFTAKFTENLVVQVFDQNYNPVENAETYVDYQLNAVAGYVKTTPKYTNSSGEAKITFTNYEEIGDATLVAYTLYVMYGNQQLTAKLIASGNDTGTRKYSMEVESYFLSVHLVDQNARPAIGNITVNGQTKKADIMGRATFQLPPGSYDVKIEKGGYVKNAVVELSSATSNSAIDVLIENYVLKVAVVDENGKPLPTVLVEVGGLQAKTDQNGTAVFADLPEKMPLVSAIYGQYKKEAVPVLDKGDTLTFVFDREKPKITEVHDYISKAGTTSVSFIVDDAGKFSSGIDSVEVIYGIGGVENSVQTYTVGYNSFEAKIPTQAPGTVVRYYVRVTDRDGNTATESRSFVVPQNEPVVLEKNETGSNEELPQEMMIGGGIIVFAIFAYGVYYYFKNRKIAPGETGGMAEPPKIPK